MSIENGNNPQRRRSAHPYRDSVIAYAVLATVVVVLAYTTGSGLLKSVAGGVVAFVLATAWTWWRLRSRERVPERQEP